MTPQQKMLVQFSFAVLKPMGKTADTLFYDRLFRLDPKLGAILSGERRGDVIKIIGIAVDGLDRMDQILLMAENLGQRYSAYGIRDEHYWTIAEALVWTLDKGLGENFTPAVMEAWGAAYLKLATAMRRGVENGCMYAAVG